MCPIRRRRGCREGTTGSKFRLLITLRQVFTINYQCIVIELILMWLVPADGKSRKLRCMKLAINVATRVHINRYKLESFSINFI